MVITDGVFLKPPTNRPLPPTTYQLTNRPPTSRPPNSKKFKDQKNFGLIFDINTILKHKIQSICIHVLHHAHILMALGILLHVYFVFKESFKWTNSYWKVIQKAYYKLKKTLTKRYYMKRYTLKNFNEVLDIICFFY